MLDIPTSIKVDRPTAAEDDGEYVPELQMKRMMITKEDIKKYGLTEQCRGCRESKVDSQ